MVDALVLEASTSVCGFESHLPHQKKRAPKGAFFFCRQGIWHSQMPPAAAGTSASLHVWQEPAVLPHTPPPFFVIPYSLRSKRTAPATGRGLEPGCAPGFFFAPNLRPRSSRSEPSRIKEGTRKGAFFWFVPPASPRQPLPNPCRRAAHQNYSLFSIPSSLAPLRPSPPTSRERQRAAPRRGGGSVPRQQYGTAKRPFPPHGPACRAQARSEPVPQSGTPQLFTLHSSLFTLPALPLFPSGADKKKKIYFVFWSLDT